MGTLSLSVLLSSDRSSSPVVALFSGASILAGPLDFRATCYYYRKAYYRAFFLDPPACAVGEARHGATAAKQSFRSSCKICIAIFFMSLSFISCFLWRDAIRAFFFAGRIWHRSGLDHDAGEYHVA